MNKDLFSVQRTKEHEKGKIAIHSHECAYGFIYITNKLKNYELNCFLILQSGSLIFLSQGEALNRRTSVEYR